VSWIQRTAYQTCLLEFETETERIFAPFTSSQNLDRALQTRWEKFQHLGQSRAL